ncbi:hypothetical protein [Methylococcus capsulatus]|jgi:hypothetical protein|uniref:Uncharacterized protein n=1 Tax=Methylococcus capsulatus TaxID=414 RepID=A0AA35V3P0_METCP|nr:hypothetical protein [Methylococcus capsulatus]CAI8760493.1 conserved protein of unknown function [Methylococcus capsulatus]
MTQPTAELVSIVHDKVPNRIRFRVPLIRYRQTYAEILKQSILKDSAAKGIYHAEPNITTGTLLVKFHPAIHSETQVVELVRSTVANLSTGSIEITAKHKNPRIGKMRPGAFFTRELVVSIVGNVVAGLILAFVATR